MDNLVTPPRVNWNLKPPSFRETEVPGGNQRIVRGKFKSCHFEGSHKSHGCGLLSQILSSKKQTAVTQLSHCIDPHCFETASVSPKKVRCSHFRNVSSDPRSNWQKNVTSLSPPKSRNLVKKTSPSSKRSSSKMRQKRNVSDLNKSQNKPTREPKCGANSTPEVSLLHSFEKHGQISGYPALDSVTRTAGSSNISSDSRGLRGINERGWAVALDNKRYSPGASPERGRRNKTLERTSSNIKKKAHLRCLSEDRGAKSKKKKHTTSSKYNTKPNQLDLGGGKRPRADFSVSRKMTWSTGKGTRPTSPRRLGRVKESSEETQQQSGPRLTENAVQKSGQWENVVVHNWHDVSEQIKQSLARLEHSVDTPLVATKGVIFVESLKDGEHSQQTSAEPEKKLQQNSSKQNEKYRLCLDSDASELRSSSKQACNRKTKGTCKQQGCHDKETPLTMVVFENETLYVRDAHKTEVVEKAPTCPLNDSQQNQSPEIEDIIKHIKDRLDGQRNKVPDQNNALPEPNIQQDCTEVRQEHYSDNELIKSVSFKSTGGDPGHLGEPVVESRKEDEYTNILAAQKVRHVDNCGLVWEISVINDGNSVAIQTEREGKDSETKVSAEGDYAKTDESTTRTASSSDPFVSCTSVFELTDEHGRTSDDTLATKEIDIERNKALASILKPKVRGSSSPELFMHQGSAFRDEAIPINLASSNKLSENPDKQDVSKNEFAGLRSLSQESHNFMLSKRVANKSIFSNFLRPEDAEPHVRQRRHTDAVGVKAEDAKSIHLKVLKSVENRYSGSKCDHNKEHVTDTTLKSKEETRSELQSLQPEPNEKCTVSTSVATVEEDRYYDIGSKYDKGSLHESDLIPKLNNCGNLRKNKTELNKPFGYPESTLSETKEESRGKLPTRSNFLVSRVFKDNKNLHADEIFRYKYKLPANVQNHSSTQKVGQVRKPGALCPVKTCLGHGGYTENQRGYVKQNSLKETNTASIDNISTDIHELAQNSEGHNVEKASKLFRGLSGSLRNSPPKSKAAAPDLYKSESNVSFKESRDFLQSTAEQIKESHQSSNLLGTNTDLPKYAPSYEKLKDQLIRDVTFESDTCPERAYDDLDFPSSSFKEFEKGLKLVAASLRVSTRQRQAHEVRKTNIDVQARDISLRQYVKKETKSFQRDTEWDIQIEAKDARQSGDREKSRTKKQPIPHWKLGQKPRSDGLGSVANDGSSVEENEINTHSMRKLRANMQSVPCITVTAGDSQTSVRKNNETASFSSSYDKTMAIFSKRFRSQEDAVRSRGSDTLSKAQNITQSLGSTSQNSGRQGSQRRLSDTEFDTCDLSLSDDSPGMNNISNEGLHHHKRANHTVFENFPRCSTPSLAKSYIIPKTQKVEQNPSENKSSPLIFFKQPTNKEQEAITPVLEQATEHQDSDSKQGGVEDNIFVCSNVPQEKLLFLQKQEVAFGTHRSPSCLSVTDVSQLSSSKYSLATDCYDDVSAPVKKHESEKGTSFYLPESHKTRTASGTEHDKFNKHSLLRNKESAAKSTDNSPYVKPSKCIKFEISDGSATVTTQNGIVTDNESEPKSKTFEENQSEKVDSSLTFSSKEVSVSKPSTHTSSDQGCYELSEGGTLFSFKSRRERVQGSRSNEHDASLSYSSSSISMANISQMSSSICSLAANCQAEAEHGQPQSRQIGPRGELRKTEIISEFTENITNTMLQNGSIQSFQDILKANHKDAKECPPFERNEGLSGKESDAVPLGNEPTESIVGQRKSVEGTETVQTKQVERLRAVSPSLKLSSRSKIKERKEFWRRLCDSHPTPSNDYTKFSTPKGSNESINAPSPPKRFSSPQKYCTPSNHISRMLNTSLPAQMTSLRSEGVDNLSISPTADSNSIPKSAHSIRYGYNSPNFNVKTRDQVASPTALMIQRENKLLKHRLSYQRSQSQPPAGVPYHAHGLTRTTHETNNRSLPSDQAPVLQKNQRTTPSTPEPTSLLHNITLSSDFATLPTDISDSSPIPDQPALRSRSRYPFAYTHRGGPNDFRGSCTYRKVPFSVPAPKSTSQTAKPASSIPTNLDYPSVAQQSNFGHQSQPYTTLQLVTCHQSPTPSNIPPLSSSSPSHPHTSQFKPNTERPSPPDPVMSQHYPPHHSSPSPCVQSPARNATPPTYVCPPLQGTSPPQISTTTCQRTTPPPYPIMTSWQGPATHQPLAKVSQTIPPSQFATLGESRETPPPPPPPLELSPISLQGSPPPLLPPPPQLSPPLLQGTQSTPPSYHVPASSQFTPQSQLAPASWGGDKPISPQIAVSVSVNTFFSTTPIPPAAMSMAFSGPEYPTVQLPQPSGQQIWVQTGSVPQGSPVMTTSMPPQFEPRHQSHPRQVSTYYHPASSCVSVHSNENQNPQNQPNLDFN